MMVTFCGSPGSLVPADLILLLVSGYHTAEMLHYWLKVWQLKDTKSTVLVMHSRNVCSVIVITLCLSGPDVREPVNVSAVTGLQLASLLPTCGHSSGTAHQSFWSFLHLSFLCVIPAPLPDSSQCGKEQLLRLSPLIQESMNHPSVIILSFLSVSALGLPLHSFRLHLSVSLPHPSVSCGPYLLLAALHTPPINTQISFPSRSPHHWPSRDLPC